MRYTQRKNIRYSVFYQLLSSHELFELCVTISNVSTISRLAYLMGGGGQAKTTIEKIIDRDIESSF